MSYVVVYMYVMGKANNWGKPKTEKNSKKNIYFFDSGTKFKMDNSLTSG